MIDVITRHLKVSVELRNSIPQPSGMVSFEEWLLKHGEAFTVRTDLPAIDKRFKKQNQCYANAARLLMTYELDSDEWVYAEGQAIRHSLGIPLDHAWLVNRETKEVYDPTWQWKDDEFSYFGVPYDYTFLAKELLRIKVYGLHTNGVMYNRVLMATAPNELPGLAQGG